LSIVLQVEHSTVYRYANPVTFSEHRVMCRPRASHDLRVIDSTLAVSPDADIRWVHDVFSNSVAIVAPRHPAAELRIDAGFTIEHSGEREEELPLEPRALSFPFDYSMDESLDLGAMRFPQHPDPDRMVLAFAQRFAPPGTRVDTRDMLRWMSEAIRAEFAYGARDEEGTQPPAETLARRSGSCRDLALLMMEAVRRLGLAARFVSGYLYDPALDGGDVGMVGSGATHAWLHVYLPGAGWVAYDPTNTLYGGGDLIRVAFTRDPWQVPPVAGSYFGRASDYLGMSVEVKVHRALVQG
jgi:transglutaminase-like putative cysteine protease